MTYSKEIISVVVSLMLLAIGIFIIGTITTTTITGDTPILSTSYDQTFPISDPTVDQNFNTGETGLTSITVTTYNGILWKYVPAVNVSYAGSIVTVQSGGL